MTNSNLYKQLKLVQPGDHMVLIYDDQTDTSLVMSAYLASALSRNERCIYITGDAEIRELKSALSYYIDIDEKLECGQLSIIDKEEAYSLEGIFQADKMIKLLKELSKQAIEDGYSGLAVSGEISWVLNYEHGFEAIMDYEHQLNHHIFGQFPVSAICRYNIDRFSSEMMMHIVEVHPIIIWKNQIHNNPSYINTVDFLEEDLYKYKLESMLENLKKYTDSTSRFERELKRSELDYQRLQMSFMENIILSITSLLGIHDIYTKNHSENVANISMNIARQLQLDKKDIMKVYYSGLVHDLGKTLIPNSILNKPGRLDADEYDVVKQHSRWGYEALSKTKELVDISHVVLSHHEAYNGIGYPDGLVGEDIPILSRILTVADAYDAMTSDRPYRKAMSIEDAKEELLACSGSYFDPMIVNAFLSL